MNGGTLFLWLWGSLIAMGAAVGLVVGVCYLVGGHRHRWTNWQNYNGDVYTLQRRHCTVCNKMRRRVP